MAEPGPRRINCASQMREIERCRGEESRALRSIADIEGRIAQLHRTLADAQRNLAAAEARDAQRRQDDADRRSREHDSRLREISGRLGQHDAAIQRLKELPERVVVLFLAANPLDQERLRLDEEVRSIAEMIRKAEHRDAVKLESCWAVRPLDLLQAINEHHPRVVHFSGHGSHRDEILFQNDAGETKAVTKEAMVQTMAAASGDIRLVFFNTCFSRARAELVVRHVDTAIGMSTAIIDQAARVFAAQFYSAIGFGLSISRAFEQAKAALMLEGLGEEQVPELFVADGVEPADLVLVRPPDARAATEEA